VEEFEEDRRSGTLPASSILGIFRTFDRYTLAFLEDCGNQQEKTIAVVITSLLDEAERQQLEAYTARHNLDGRIFLVHSSASIKDDLS
jgi:flagellar biosynthesis/type III secretory pathway ATPase